MKKLRESRRRSPTSSPPASSICAASSGRSSGSSRRISLRPRAHGANSSRLLPHDTGAALRLARKRDARMKGRARLAIDEERPLRHAVEIRHESFVDGSFVELLREHSIALVIAETARRWPMTHDVTADFVYMRLHGDKELYKSGYSRQGTRPLGEANQSVASRRRAGGDAKIAAHPASGPRDIYCYFDNTDVKLRAPFDAQR